ncbi:MAG: aminotransferase class V-fold PLP-dependent enzyme [Actinomycetota bacterium]|nr:aminotransferase class V-fold PLP-dependent enzyme [Actinomycetota bacterium]
MYPELRALFAPEAGYLNTASLGIPPSTALEAMAAVLDGWRRGLLHPPDFDDAVNRSRAAWAAMSGVDVSCVATGAAVSQFVGLVAAALPDDARVIAAEGEFTSVTFPFLAHSDRGVRVAEVALDDLAETRGRVDLIAVSAVQSADGRLADVPALIRLAKETGARLLLDTTQSCGWLPIDCSPVDYVVCGAYKWLLSPRGTAFMAVRPEHLDGLRPLAAGWYAGDDPWTSIYGSPLRLASDARRFDLSPAWFCWAGAAASLELLSSLDHAEIREHNVALADDFLDRLGQPGQGSAIVTVGAPEAAARLDAAGVRTAVRAGRARASFHLYNDQADVARAAVALGH